METGAEFLIHDPRLGEPVWDRDMPRRITGVSIELLRPVREAMIGKGWVAGEVRGGKPWGAGFDIGGGKSRVSVFFCPVPASGKNRWEGSIHLLAMPSFWRSLPGIRDEAAEERAVERVAGELKGILATCPFLTGVRWRSLQRLGASDGDQDDKDG